MISGVEGLSPIEACGGLEIMFMKGRRLLGFSRRRDHMGAFLDKLCELELYDYCEAVSYTHLDVYKRQGIRRSSHLG